MYYIYKHTSPNGKVYIGQTKREKPEYRWNNGKGYKNRPEFYKDILAFGWDNFKHEILETVETYKEAIERENYYITKFNSANCGYNTSGRAVICVETEIIYNNATEAAKELNLNQSHIHECAKGTRHTHGGYHWCYLQEPLCQKC